MPARTTLCAQTSSSCLHALTPDQLKCPSHFFAANRTFGKAAQPDEQLHEEQQVSSTTSFAARKSAAPGAPDGAG
eukprot:1250266-Pleurochrysis_carterae.AAC.1